MTKKSKVNTVRTSKGIAAKASKIMRTNKSKQVRSIASSALCNRKKTSKK